MKKLIAKTPILWGGRQYAPGDPLPTSDAEILELWLKYGSAAWDGHVDTTDATGSPAVPQTSGLPVPDPEPGVDKPAAGRRASQKRAQQ